MGLKDRYIFLQKLFHQPTVNASVTPSSRFLAEAMVHGIDFSRVKTVVEFGPWTWVITKAIIKNVPEHVQIICVEFDKTYVDMIHTLFGKRVTIIHGNVNDLYHILQKHNLQRPDVIISWLPFTVYTPELIKHLGFYIQSWTIFRWFSYLPHKIRDIYKPLPLKQKTFVLRNVPPAFVFWAN